jgi:hypothetical protein
MSRSTAAIIWLILVSALVPVPFVALDLSKPPDFVGSTLALLLVLATSIKFALAEELSSEGFNPEKTACDIALALASALISLAVVQQFEADRILLPIAWLLSPPADGWPAALSEARRTMWQLSAIAFGSFFLSFLLAREARSRRSADGRFDRLISASCRVTAVVLGSVCWSLYYLTVLLKD